MHVQNVQQQRADKITIAENGLTVRLEYSAVTMMMMMMMMVMKLIIKMMAF